MGDDRQLALSFNSSTGARMPIVLTAGMSDDELRRARAIMFPPAPPPTKVNLLANPEFIEVASVVAARLDHIRFERKKATVFTQTGVLDHCNEVMNHVMHGDDKSQWPEIPFDVHEWFHDLRGGDLDYNPEDPLLDIDLAQFDPTLQVDWIQVLIEQELKTPGFCKVLYNCLELESRIAERLGAHHKRTMGTLGTASGF